MLLRTILKEQSKEQSKDAYKNGDISWNTYDGTFKAYNKDGNEVKFPAEDTNYEVRVEPAENTDDNEDKTS